MRGVGVGRCALGICAAAAMLAGCGGSQPSNRRAGRDAANLGIRDARRS
jgi:hypothetical protein